MIALLIVIAAILVVYCSYLACANYRLEGQRAQLLAKAKFAKRQLDRVSIEFAFAWPEVVPLADALRVSIETGVPWPANQTHRAMRAKRYVFPDAGPTQHCTVERRSSAMAHGGES
jgi:hypothetical protein